MPLYDYICNNNHVTEQRRPISTSQVGCPVCGQEAKRAPFYLSQYINCETGPKGGLKNPVPPDQMDLKQDVSEFVEASAEVDHMYTKAEEEIGKSIPRPNLYKKGLQKARAKGVKT